MVTPASGQERAQVDEPAAKVDERLFSGRTAGYRFEDMPQDGEAYRRFLRAIDLMALAAHGAQFFASGLARG